MYFKVYLGSTSTRVGFNTTVVRSLDSFLLTETQHNMSNTIVALTVDKQSSDTSS